MIEQKSAFYISQKLITLKAKEICITIRKGRKEVIIKKSPNIYKSCPKIISLEKNERF